MRATFVRPEGLHDLPVLDLLAPAMREHSNRILGDLRRAGPLCHVQPFGSLGVLRFADVDAVLRDFKSYTSDVQFLPPLEGAEAASELRTLIRQDPPEHTFVRGLVRQALSLERLGATEVRIRKMVGELVGAIVLRGETFDLLDDLAVPLPVTVIAELLGIDPNDRRRFRKWSDDLVSRVPAHYAEPGVERGLRLAEIATSLLGMDEYLREAIARRRREPQDDLITAFVQASEAANVFSEEDIVSLVRLLLIAGNETTTRLLGLAMDAFLREPGQLELLAASPDLAVNAVEEALRYEGPVIALTRGTTRPVQIAGFDVPTGALVSPILASANHDEAVFPDPDTFDIRRKIRRHLAFGGGIHACIGAPIARVEMRIALEEIVASMDHIAAAGPARRAHGSLRGFEKMPLRFERRESSTPRSSSVRVVSATKSAP